MSVRLIGDRAMNRVVSHEGSVQRRIHYQTEVVGAIAKMRLLGHRHAGVAKVTTSYGDTDGFINLDDKAALSIEFGHWVKGKYERTVPKYVPGLYIITGAAGLA